MNNNETVTATEQQHRKEAIRKKLMKGDFVTISKMLGITTDNVRIRFVRQKEDVLKAAEMLIDSREELITEYQNW